MSFGLFNAPASFYSYINKILAKKLDIFVIVYPDISSSIPRTQAKLTSILFDKFPKN